MSAIIVVLEGLICAGKTTLLNKLGRLANCRSIQEYKEYLKKFENLPPFSPCDIEKALQASQFYVTLERCRQNDLAKFLDQDVIVIFDRGILSCLAFDYAAKRFNGIDTYLETIQMYQAECFHQPHLCLYLDISYETMINRMKLRGTYSGDQFANRKFTEFLAEFYWHFLSLPQFIKINGELSEQEVFNQTLTAINDFSAKKEHINILEIAKRLA